MTDLQRRLAQASRHFTVDWHGDHLAAQEVRLVSRLHRRRRLRKGAGALVALVMIGGAAVGLHRSDPNRITFADGSVAQLTPATQLVRESAPPGATALDLETGSARFDVTHQEHHPFRVRAGRVLVEVIGTRFLVKRLGSGAEVAVDRGRVRVSWAGETEGSLTLEAGQQGVFPPAAQARPAALAPAPVPVVADNAAAPAPEPVPAQTRPAAVHGSWRTLAQQGHYDRAYRALATAGRGQVKDEADDLLTAADVARLSGHPAEAVIPLQRILGSHPGDPRASLAAFTLGRVLLDELQEGGKAAEAFERSRLLAPRSPLVPDALAHEAEAWSRAGNFLRARGAAAEYLRRFPNGAQAAAMTAYGRPE